MMNKHDTDWRLIVENFGETPIDIFRTLNNATTSYLEITDTPDDVYVASFTTNRQISEKRIDEAMKAIAEKYSEDKDILIRLYVRKEEDIFPNLWMISDGKYEKYEPEVTYNLIVEEEDPVDDGEDTEDEDTTIEDPSGDDTTI